MNLSKEIIERFLAGHCTPEEAAALLDALKEQPGLLDAYMGKEDWDGIDENNAMMPPDAAARTTKAVLKHTTRTAPGAFLIQRKWMMAAACLVALGITAFYLFKQQVSPQDNQAVAQSKEISKDVPLNKDTVVKNTGKEKLTVVLKDGSHLLLSSQAEIRYEPRFTGTTRTIHLKGEAYFKVAKDKSRPFIVYSHNITTTALGTSFTIRALDNEELVTVALHTGKVVVKPITVQAGAAKDIYLVPGDQLTVNVHNFKTQIARGKPADTLLKAAPLKKEVLLEFDREPLTKVLNKLTQEYGTAIEFDETLLSEQSFTGNLKTDEPLEKILQNIALLNNLTITRTPKGYSVSTRQ